MTSRGRVRSRRPSPPVLVGLALLIAGSVAAIVAVALFVAQFSGIPDRLDARPTVPVPGEGTIRIERGERGVWLEVRSPSRPDLRDIIVTITPTTGGEPLRVLFPRTLENYDISGRRGALIGTVAVPATGDYTVVVEGRGGDNVSIGAPTVSEDLVDPTVPFIVLAAGALTVIVGIVVLAATFVRRRRERTAA